jgi:hypothetical protein
MIIDFHKGILNRPPSQGDFWLRPSLYLSLNHNDCLKQFKIGTFPRRHPPFDF